MRVTGRCYRGRLVVVGRRLGRTAPRLEALPRLLSREVVQRLDPRELVDPGAIPAALVRDGPERPDLLARHGRSRVGDVEAAHPRDPPEHRAERIAPCSRLRSGGQRVVAHRALARLLASGERDG